MDYDLSANNGNWQWSAEGCDGSIFQVFNPEEQQKNLTQNLFILKMGKEFGTSAYPKANNRTQIYAKKSFKKKRYKKVWRIKTFKSKFLNFW